MNVNNDRIEVTYECDVLVIGSGVSGYCAAIQAGRSGCRTILLEKDEVLGGNSGPNCGVCITGADRHNPYGTETGIIHELHEDAAWINAFTHVTRGSLPYNISRRFEAVVQEHLENAGVRILKRHYAKLPIMRGNRIVGVVAEDLAAFRTVKINVHHVVIEASGDGHIGASAGADFDMGSEGKDEFDERSAPPKKTKLVQGTSLVAIAHRTSSKVLFRPPTNTPSYSPRIRHDRISSFINQHERVRLPADKDLIFLYITETGGDMDTILDDAEIYEHLLKQLWAEWNHIKNGPHKEEAECWDLLWVSPKAGKRESRRFMGDYVLTQTDLEDGRRFTDAIAYGGHFLDDHQPFRSSANIVGHSVPPLYEIPYRCCYSRNIKNLLLAGRLISATHLAHSSVRVMRTGGAIGQAVGMAAALCCKYGSTPREIYNEHVNELQQKLLKADATILTKSLEPNLDLARQSEVEASSELKFNNQEPDFLVPLLSPAGNVLWDWNPDIESVELFLSNYSIKEQKIRLSIYKVHGDRKWKTMNEFSLYGRNDLRDSAFKRITTTETVLPTEYEGWFRIRFSEPIHVGKKDVACDDDRLIIALDDNKDVSWAIAKRCCEIAEMVEHIEGSWKTLGFVGTMRITPAPNLGEAENVVNSLHRRFSRGPTNMWISDQSQGLPQDLILSWPHPQRFNEVTLTFDNLMQSHFEYPWDKKGRGNRVLDKLVKEYELHIWKNGAWKKIINNECNHNRFQIHTFKPVETNKLRLRVLSTHGEQKSARVYQICIHKR